MAWKRAGEQTQFFYTTVRSITAAFAVPAEGCVLITASATTSTHTGSSSGRSGQAPAAPALRHRLPGVHRHCGRVARPPSPTPRPHTGEPSRTAHARPKG
jgi:hypothetical protein